MVALLVPLTTTFFWFSISSLCVHYNVHGCSAMLLSLLQPPSSGSLSVPCVSTTMCMVALLVPLTTTFFWFSISSLCVCYNVHGCSASPSYNHLLLVLYQFPVCPLQCAWLLCYATVPLTTTFFWFSISSLCVHYNVHGCSASPSYNHLLLVLYQFPVCPLQCAWLLC